MATVIYSPGIRVFIATANKGTIEVSDDISSGSLRLAVGTAGGHKLSLSLTNDDRKYEGIFAPNDRVVVFAKRVRWIQLMSGYLDSVPMFSATAKAVNLSASCTLKRLLYSLYDEGSPAFANLMTQDSTGSATSIDSNMGQRFTDVLVEIGGWDRDKIHVGSIPPEWFQTISDIYEEVSPGFAASIGPIINGASPLAQGISHGTATGPGGTSQGPGYGVLPSSSGRIGQYGDVGTVGTLGVLDLSQEYASAPADQWYVGMRWPYRTEVSADPEALGMTMEQQTAARAWWLGQRLLVMNPKTMKTICVRPAFWGPLASTGRVLDLSPAALAELGMSSGDYAQMTFAPFRVETAPSLLGQVTTTPLGVYIQPTTGIGSVTGTSSSAIPTSANSSIARLTPTSPSEPTNIPTTTSGDAGISFTGRDNLKPNVAAARDFINLSWPDVPNIGGYAPGTGHASNSDHYTGQALDVSTGNGNVEPTPEQVALGNSIAFWFTQNPDVFGNRAKYVIWNNMFYSSRGAAIYHAPDDPNGTNLSLSHRNHVHISFEDTGQTAMGASGNGWPVNTSDFSRVASLGGVVSSDRASSITAPSGSTFQGFTGPGQLITTTWTAIGEAVSVNLTGPRQLLNDTPLMVLANQLSGASMRDYCSAPNGDIIAWWPDLFNQYGTCSQLVLQDIELQPFTIQWSDSNLVTHQFVIGSVPLGQFVGNAALSVDNEFALRQFFTHGIASIDFPEILRALFNTNPNDLSTAGWTDTQALYQRFGARVNKQNIPWIASPEVEFWYAVHLFRESWAAQFSTQVPISWMPELYPGMILQIPGYGLQLYVDQVEHSWDLGPDGSGFRTSVSCKAPSTIGRQNRLYGLPVGGTWIGSLHPGENMGGVTPELPRRA